MQDLKAMAGNVDDKDWEKALLASACVSSPCCRQLLVGFLQGLLACPFH